MKRLLSTLSILIMTVMAFPTNASDVDKSFRKIIRDYDVPSEVKDLAPNTPVVFWKETINSNEYLIKFRNDMKKKKGAEKDTQKKLNDQTKLYAGFDESIIWEDQPFCDSILNTLGISGLGFKFKCDMHVIDYPDPDVYTMPTENGFAICITSALLDRKGVTPEVVQGFIANEFVHSVFSHIARNIYSQEKKDRRNTALLSVFVPLVLAGEIYMDLTYPYNYPVYVEQNTEINIDLTPLKKIIPYTPSQIYEADLVAFRLMQNLGIEQAYIDGLKILSMSDAEEANPSVTQRINFINFVVNNPSLGNTKFAKMRQSRLNLTSQP